MPEGDTVRRTAAGLDRALAGRVLTTSQLRWDQLADTALAGWTVAGTHAYGKHLLTRLTGDGPDLTLHSHLRMDGSWRIVRTGGPLGAPSHTIRATLRTTEWTAVGILLGMLDLVPTARESDLIGHLGPDIMAAEWDVDGGARAAAAMAADGERWIGSALLDQRAVAGIGTFYMAEALFQHRISPWTAAADVDVPAVLSIARRQLLRSVQSPIPTTTGSTQRGRTSYVHGRSGKPCRRCGDTVRVAPVGVAPHERPAFYCPTCQPGPTPTDDGRPIAPLGSRPHRPGSARNVGLIRR